ncbi:AAA family ATPase [Mycobacterium yunnanensis]|uniref:AAA family ATPase n=1 Tax=Mycobacterium yunnanensis TaxID=368477 RepID=A0A9X2Z5Z2_9MYCO|nr:AAA family ATPase [Mycobacterium yunnanensis]MCV7423925.1 AAA family ATPase [Mycobacterium yunnanensis]
MTEAKDGAEESGGMVSITWEALNPNSVRFKSLELQNFLSYKNASLDLSDFIAIVGPNASGKSNAVAALRLLREIPSYGLPTAIARRGGFDQLRHRSRGHPYDPSLRLCFEMHGSGRTSSYLLSFGSVKGGQYKIKREAAELFFADGSSASFDRTGDAVRIIVSRKDSKPERFNFNAVAGQSIIPAAGIAGITVYEVLQRIQTVEVNPAKVGDLQEPSSTATFESDGSNVASIYDSLDKKTKQDVVDRLAAIVPGIVAVEVYHLADRLTLRFKQTADDGLTRTFLAKQMSDGTLRAFAIMVALLQNRRPTLLVIEEPEVAIHLGALGSLVQLLEAETNKTQVLVTTHSADIIDALPIDSLRIVWHENGVSNVARLAEHSKIPVRKGLITPGQLLRSDSLDPVIS